tara:strand:+ start:1553 stop:1789 length:237 start_codon:yes stop_codon:yes gene_type:complete
METTSNFSMKKSVSWATQLEVVYEYDKPSTKLSYAHLSKRIGKPQRVSTKLSYAQLSLRIGKPQRINISDKQDCCICA